MSGPSPGLSTGEGQSSSRPPVRSARNSVEIDEEGADLSLDSTLLADDPLSEIDNTAPLSFRKKSKQPSGLRIPQFFSTPLNTTSNVSSRNASPGPRPSAPLPTARSRRLRDLAQNNGSDTSLDRTNGQPVNGTAYHDTKEGAPIDWYTEGPGRRVGYDDLTAIDWIFEYTKERQRLRYLSSQATNLFGYAQQILDASQIWIVLVATGIAAGILAAGINVASDWLGDLKTGYCQKGEGGGSFYLNRGFCCWGHDEWAQCQGWTSWSRALHISSAAGAFIIEYLFFFVFSVVFAVSASFLVQRFAPYAKHSGIPEIKTVLGGFVMRRFMGAWTLVVKSLGLCLAVASGLWLGKEGPLVHVACCCANLFLKLAPSINDNEARKREVLSAAAAAGISVAFGSPIGGVLFSLEQLSYYFPDKTMWQSFVCAMVAAVTLQAFNPFRTGKLVLYQVTYTTGWHGFEIGPYALLGILGGIYGGLFIKLNLKIAKWRRSSRFSDKPVLEVMVASIVTAILNFPNKFMRAQSSELVYMLFAECAAITDDQFGICKKGAATAGVVLLLFQAALIGFLLASFTFGLRIPAGIILPSMAIGGLCGRAVGVIMEIWQHDHPSALIFSTCEPDIPCITPGTYAIVGAAAALAGVTRMTVSIVVIMFELTGALTYVLPIMIAVMTSKWVGDAFGTKGIYETWIHFNEYPFLDNRDDPVPDVPVSQIMTQIDDIAVLPASGDTIQTLQDWLSTQPYRGFPVVTSNTNKTLLGYISRTELIYSLQIATAEPRKMPPSTAVSFAHQPSIDPQTTLDLRPWIDHTPFTLSSRSSLQLTVTMFSRLGLRYVLFTEKGKLRGLLTKKDIWYVLDSTENDLGIGAGVLREEQGGESRGLLNRDGSDVDSLRSPEDER
ncbi:uncharacterized protein KY384_003089 [Bacidia gigantensis]|uniref:uncharacterized protein n=1 Tax=Bacidia gigantensis TaxID=2732470 RepID=UPI001D04E9BF|nr:uncharacterized protein KY384_003089 [Bacidia gigantensis]KAG8531460.1 hypothetical protein KY384_003089 [Bacidia gigantensis]